MAAGDVTVSITSNNSKKAAIFDGTDDVITVTDDATITNVWDNGGTMSFWVNPTNIGENNNGNIIHKGESNRWFIDLNIGTAASAKLRLFIKFDGATNGSWRTTDAQIPYNTWTHVAVIYKNDTTSENPIFYINGTALTVGSGLNELNTPDGTRVSDTALNMYFGNNNAASSSRTLHGAITEIKMFGTELTSAEITSLKQGVTVTRELISEWTFQDGTYNDSVGSNNGSNTGSYIEIVEDVISLAVKSQRTTANDKYLITGFPGGQLVHAVIEET